MDKTSHILVLFGTILVTVAWPISVGLTHVEVLRVFIESNFATTFLSTLMAAFAGAWGAQYIVEKEKRKEQIRAEFLSINSCLSTCVYGFNSFIGLKKQHLIKLREDYVANKEAALISCLKIEDIKFNLQILPLYDLPINNLRNTIHEKINLNARGLVFVNELSGTYFRLNSSIEERNKYITNYRKRAINEDHNSLFREYLSIRDPEKVTDLSFESICEAVWMYNEDCIYYTYHLSKILHAYACNLKVMLNDKNLSLIEVDFSPVEKVGLLPNFKNYENLEKSFL